MIKMINDVKQIVVQRLYQVSKKPTRSSDIRVRSY